MEAWGYIKRLIDAEVFVKGANAMDDGAARTLFVDGTTAIYNSGSWTPGIFVNEAPDLKYDYFNLPPINGNVSIPAGYNGLIIPSYVDEQKLPVIIDFLNTSFGKEYARVVYEMGAIPDNTAVSASDFAEIVHPIVRRIIEDVRTHGDVGIIDALQSPPHRQGTTTRLPVSSRGISLRLRRPRGCIRRRSTRSNELALARRQPEPQESWNGCRQLRPGDIRCSELQRVERPALGSRCRCSR